MEFAVVHGYEVMACITWHVGMTPLFVHVVQTLVSADAIVDETDGRALIATRTASPESLCSLVASHPLYFRGTGSGGFMEQCVFEVLRAAWHAMHRWDGITAIGTIAAAMFTAVMAWFTRKAISEGQEQRAESNRHFAAAREQDKQHHQDSFRPILVLAPFDPAHTFQRQDIIQPYINNQMGSVFIGCCIQNIGDGPALNIHLFVRDQGRTAHAPSREFVPIAANGSYRDTDSRIEVPVIFGDHFNLADLERLPNRLWILALEYQDIFGNTFHTIHSKSSMEPWTRTGRDRAPDTTPQLLPERTA